MSLSLKIAVLEFQMKKMILTDRKNFLCVAFLNTPIPYWCIVLSITSIYQLLLKEIIWCGLLLNSRLNNISQYLTTHDLKCSNIEPAKQSCDYLLDVHLTYSRDRETTSFNIKTQFNLQSMCWSLKIDELNA